MDFISLSQLETTLPKLTSSDVQIPAEKLTANEILGIEVNVIGDSAVARTDILGFPIIARHQFGSNTRVEIEAFLVSVNFDEQ